MNRISEGRLQLRIRSLALCFCLTVTGLLIEVAAEPASAFGSSLLEWDVKSKGETGPISEALFIGNGESTTSSMESLVPRQGSVWSQVWHKFYHRVFQLAEEQPRWPELKFGWRTVTALVLGGVGAAMSSAGGIGGGGLFVPLFNLLLEFDAKTSAALSNFMILGGSLANFTGVILNVVLPEWMITALLTLTLSYMTIHSYKGALCRWKKETKENCLRQELPKNIKEVQQSSNGGQIPSQIARKSSMVTADKEDEENQKTSISCSGVEESLSEPLLPLEESCGRSFLPIDKVLVLAVTWIAFFAIQVLRGKGGQSIWGIPECGWGYWLLTLTQIPLALGLTVWTIVRLHAAHPSNEDPEFKQSLAELSSKIRYSVEEDGFVLKPESFTPFACMALMAGLLGGLLGIGGGMIINPMFLAVGMMPQVTAGTCASMVFFSSSMSVVQFWLMGRVPVGYALTVALLCFLSSSVGITLVHWAIAKYNRASLIVFSVATVMGISAILMAGFGGLSAWQGFESGAYMGFHYPC